MAIQEERWRRVRSAQDEEAWIVECKRYLSGEVDGLDSAQVERCAKLAPSFEVDARGLVRYISPSGRMSPHDGTEDPVARVVMPTTLHEESLNHYHSSLDGSHQGVSRTFARIRETFYWRGLFRSVQEFAARWPDCTTGKGVPRLHAPSPGNIIATRPFQVVAMDFIPALPVSYLGNSELLVFVDLFAGFTILKATHSRTAKNVAEVYEEADYRRFRASEALRHDREAGFVSAFFRQFNELMGQRQRATLAYRPQANGMAARKV
ncbi:TPA: hypothetical protein N0F65_011086 [Lagenidium giganteum]|uniref:Integrase catalytic domain-containing protein n=1 Tax=Lagenidium giganteum TaxID=4803 RepID=A0AAV2ZC26_9STRA|nr:TPA: hypothetical protein N0F65_011086 [Lagenidium giganteum]